MQYAQSQDIVRQLFDDYYSGQERAEKELTSSHWRQYHQDTKVRFDGASFLSLSGVGFGDLQNRSLVYRFFSWLTILCYLTILKNRREIIKLLPDAIKLAKRMGLFFTYDAFRQVCLLASLQPFLENSGKRVVNIGDGYGFLSALIKTRYPEAKIVLIDLGKTLLFQAYFCRQAFPGSQHHLVSAVGKVPTDADFTFCPAEDLRSLDGQQFDIAINVASMQEMNDATVKGYFDFLRKTLKREGYFYCCNREEKVMPGGEVSRITEYPWRPEDKHLWDEICPWYRFFLSWHLASRGPKIGGIRVPIINYFDGPLRHRLTQLSLN